MAEKNKLVLLYHPLYLLKKQNNNRAAVRQCSSTYGGSKGQERSSGDGGTPNHQLDAGILETNKKIHLPQDAKGLPRAERPIHPPRTTQCTLHPPTDKTSTTSAVQQSAVRTSE